MRGAARQRGHRGQSGSLSTRGGAGSSEGCERTRRRSVGGVGALRGILASLSKQPPPERRIRGGWVGRSRSAGYPRVNRSSLRVLLRDGGVGALRGILASRSKQLPTADALAVAARKRAADPIGAGGSISPRWRAADPSPPALSLKGRGRRTALETGVSQGSPWGRGWGFARPAASRGAPRPKWRSTSRCRRSRGTWPGRSGPACAPARCGPSPGPVRASRAAP